ncbi:chaplin family protein [Paractinoplanes lichenicola]|uniref:Chaplin n=1 Tax=Paractinoplanes lichenicola TaxID=2802976 RepID=A0ABS1W224_9ACTN|nr:chaplin family protein [Actinoplanes lichenicola]MBL7260790.1 chaplin [Actinoplanes lichenicola]
MKTWVRKTLSVGVLAAGALLFAPAAAQADSKQVTGANNGILNGTQIAVPVNVPINVVGNSLAILGAADAQGVGFNHTESGRRGDAQVTGVNNGIANGTQAYLPVSVPVNVVGNSAAVLGHASATGVGINGRKAESARTTEGARGGWGGDTQFTGLNNGIANGTQIYAPIDVPINVCGNSLAILGGAYSQAICSNNTRGDRHFHRGIHGRKAESAQGHRGGRGGAVQATGVNNGILNGTQLYAPISLPINLSGNSAALLGSASSRAISRNESGHGDDFVQATGANNGILNGTQVAVPINVPINACGNSLGILGAAQSAAACSNGEGFGFGRNRDRDWDGDWDRPGHGHDHGDDVDGDHGDVDDDDYKGNGGVKPATNDGYGDVQDDTNDEMPADDEAPATDDNDGYTKPAAAGSNSDSKGGRGGNPTEASPISSLTDTVGGVGSLGLLNTLR